MASSVASATSKISSVAAKHLPHQTTSPRSLPELGRNARVLYKELLKYTKVHPNAIKKTKYLTQIRKDFRRYRDLRDASRIEDLLKKGSSRLGYIRMEIPSSLIPLKYRMENIRQNPENITTLSVDDNGNIASSVSTLITKARFVNWCDGNNDPDEKRKNDSLIERVNYRGPYWEKRRKGWLPQDAHDLWEGPGISEALMHREKYDIGFDLPTQKLEDHPDVRGHMPGNNGLCTRKDFDLDEPDVVEMKVKQKKEVDYDDIAKGMQVQFNDDQRDKSMGKPNVLEFLRGRREK